MSAAWRTNAACAGRGAQFFPEPGIARIDYAKARLVCAACPVREQCLTAAMAAEGSADGRSRYGMWGGLTPDERAGRYREAHAPREAAA
jgi:WhiB family redox-sensing transcriptional regulator